MNSNHLQKKKRLKINDFLGRKHLFKEEQLQLFQGKYFGGLEGFLQHYKLSNSTADIFYKSGIADQTEQVDVNEWCFKTEKQFQYILDQVKHLQDRHNLSFHFTNLHVFDDASSIGSSIFEVLQSNSTDIPKEQTNTTIPVAVIPQQPQESIPSCYFYGNNHHNINYQNTTNDISNNTASVNIDKQDMISLNGSICSRPSLKRLITTFHQEVINKDDYFSIYQSLTSDTDEPLLSCTTDNQSGNSNIDFIFDNKRKQGGKIGKKDIINLMKHKYKKENFKVAAGPTRVREKFNNDITVFTSKPVQFDRSQTKDDRTNNSEYQTALGYLHKPDECEHRIYQSPHYGVCKKHFNCEHYSVIETQFISDNSIVYKVIKFGDHNGELNWPDELKRKRIRSYKIEG